MLCRAGQLENRVMYPHCWGEGRWWQVEAQPRPIHPAHQTHTLVIPVLHTPSWFSQCWEMWHEAHQQVGGLTGGDAEYPVDGESPPPPRLEQGLRS